MRALPQPRSFRRCAAAALVLATLATAVPAAAQPSGWRADLPPFVNPFNPGAGPLSCEAIRPPSEREKFGFSADCSGAAPAARAAPEAAPQAAPAAPVALASDRATAPATAGGATPLTREDLPDLYRRVLSLPGARLSPEPGAQGPGDEVPAFTVYHVYAEREIGGARWVQLGRDAFGGVEGWAPAEAVEDWKTMLVMRYAPKGKRGRVLFFKRRNDLQALNEDSFVAQEVAAMYEEIESGQHDGDYLTAIEPALGVDGARPYLMPVLDHHRALTALGEPIRLLEVAGLNLAPDATVQTDVREVEDLGAPRRAGALRQMKIGVAFVIDTTVTMGPYIELTRAIVGSTLGALEQAGALDKFSFGLVGYRDNVEAGDRIEYVTRVFQPLDPNASPQAMLRNFELMTPARGSTQGFNEDAFAGLHVALNELDWTPFDARLVVLISDAGPRPAADALAAYPGYGPLNIVEDANRLNAAITVMHLITSEAERVGNVGEALRVYREVARTGDRGLDKYLPIDTREPDAFMDQITSFQQGLIAAVEQLGRSRPVERVEEPQGDSALGSVLVNEVFRAQLEYLGADRGQEAPRFYRAWASDRDLADPALEALGVEAFLTRNQIAALSKGVETILDAYLRKETAGGDFFDAMQAIAAETSVEGAQSGDVKRAGDLLPSFLQALPYRSAILTLDRAQWAAMAGGQQRETIDALQSKLVAYREIAQERTGWIDLGAGDRGLDAYPLSLDLLP
ncbi:MAG: vWA domain-containing protein [Rubrimonas sp.]|uniref:vWA domain-containing protein n=1 Tax=Rubrimonas sp. TaxID=2036015 RepID=UPI002FDCF7C7